MRPGRDRTTRRARRRGAARAPASTSSWSPAGRSRPCASATARRATSRDRSDAYVLADCLRTDGHRWPLAAARQPSDGHAALPTSGPARTSSRHRVAVANQLRAHLRVVFPGAVGPVPATSTARSACASSSGSPRPPGRLALGETARRLAGAPTATAAARPRRALRPSRATPPAGSSGDEGDARGAVTVAFVNVLKALRAQIDELDDPHRRTARRPPRRPDLPVPAPLRHHPRRHLARRDRRLPRPLPRPRVARLPRRRRPLHPRLRPPPTPSPSAGAADKKLRDALCDFAGDSWRANAWAEHRYRQLRADGKTPPPRRTHPRPQLGPHHLALLARPHPLRPRPPRRPPTPHRRGGLT